MNKNWTLRLPVPVEFGAGCLRTLPNYLAGLRRVQVVTGRHAMRAAGVTEHLCRLLTDAGLDVQVYDGISAEPNREEVDEAAAQARIFQAEAVVGLGGGSALDAAKAVAVVATHPGGVWEYIGYTAGKITNATLPVIAVTSTSGTGSHVGRVAVVSDRSKGVKRALASDCLLPRAAICDAEILCTMPRNVTANTGWDAFAHALEGYLSNLENPMGAVCALEAMRLIHRTLPRALENLNDLTLRDEMAWGDTLAGISLATNAVVIPHVIAMVLGGRYGVPHGPAIAAVTLASLEHSRPQATRKLADVARALGCQAASEEALADAAIAEIGRFIQAIGLPVSVAAYGVPDDAFESIGAEVTTDFAVRVQADPLPTDAQGVAAILRRSAHRG
ncbi:MAG: iron-containing alcohol dehydrogenase family protein [Anaerolineae bacterium]